MLRSSLNASALISSTNVTQQMAEAIGKAGAKSTTCHVTRVFRTVDAVSRQEMGKGSGVELGGGHLPRFVEELAKLFRAWRRVHQLQDEWPPARGNQFHYGRV